MCHHTVTDCPVPAATYTFLIWVCHYDALHQPHNSKTVKLSVCLRSHSSVPCRTDLFFSTVFKTVMELTQTYVQWMLETLSLKVYQQGHEAEHSASRQGLEQVELYLKSHNMPSRDVHAQPTLSHLGLPDFWTIHSLVLCIYIYKAQLRSLSSTSCIPPIFEIST